MSPLSDSEIEESYRKDAELMDKLDGLINDPHILQLHYLNLIVQELKELNNNLRRMK